MFSAAILTYLLSFIFNWYGATNNDVSRQHWKRESAVDSISTAMQPTRGHVCAQSPTETILKYVIVHRRGATTFSKLGGPIPWSRVLCITTLQQKEIRQVYPVWCSLLHNHTLFIKMLCKKLGGPSKFWGVWTPPPILLVVAPMVHGTDKWQRLGKRRWIWLVFAMRCMQLFWRSHIYWQKGPVYSYTCCSVYVFAV